MQQNEIINELVLEPQTPNSHNLQIADSQDLQIDKSSVLQTINLQPKSEMKHDQENQSKQIIYQIHQDYLNLYETPQQLLDFFKNLNGKKMSYNELYVQVHDATIQCNLFYTASNVGRNRSTQTFSCQFRDHGCKAFVQFLYRDDTVYFDTYHSQHNHEITAQYPDRSRNTLTTEDIEFIHKQTENNLSAHAIRNMNHNKIDLISKNIMYHIREKVIHRVREDDISLLQAAMKKRMNWYHILGTSKEESNGETQEVFKYFYSFHIAVITKIYSHDVIIIDDTSCTNFYFKPLVTMIAADENGSNQIVSFAVTERRTIESFVSYFTKLKEHIGDVGVFLTDRNAAQIAALRQVWPEAKIMYCLEHIARNIKTNVGAEMEETFQSMRYGKITEKQLFDKFDEKIQEGNPKMTNFLTRLKEQKDSWLPSITNTYNHYGNNTTNRVEGFFGLLKRRIEHKKQYLSKLCDIMLSWGEKAYLDSQKTQRLVFPSEILDEKTVRMIGFLPLKKLIEEYQEMYDEYLYDLEAKANDANCCELKSQFRLPCRHLLAKRIMENKNPLLTIEDFPERWKHQGITHPSIDSVISLENAKNEPIENFSYANCLALFEDIFDKAERVYFYKEILKLTKNIVDHATSNFSGTALSNPNIFSNYYSQFAMFLAKPQNGQQIMQQVPNYPQTIIPLAPQTKSYTEQQKNATNPTIRPPKVVAFPGASDMHPRRKVDHK